MFFLSRLMFLAVLLCGMVLGGCIPSTPPETPPVPAPVVSPPPVAPVPAPSAAEGETSGAMPVEQPVAPAPEPASGKAALRVSLDEDSAPEQGFEMPYATLTPVEGTKGYRIVAHYPVEGLAMQGKLMPDEAGHWHLTGAFQSVIASYAPGAPEAHVLGQLTPQQGAGLGFVGSATEVMISFASPMPPPDAARLSEPVTTPFELKIAAPEDAAFTIVFLPF